MNLPDLRNEYNFEELSESKIPANPFDLFEGWLNDAIKANIIEPNAMTLSTVCEDGGCASRIVLLKDIKRTEQDGAFCFFTNFNSNKGGELQKQPKASLCFFWSALGRQINIKGIVSKLTEEESAIYFQSRPRDSQLSACISNQSQPLENRIILENRFHEIKQKFEPDKKIPKPKHWGGFSLTPSEIHFWQGRESRLHDRILYKKNTHNNKPNLHWVVSRLYP